MEKWKYGKIRKIRKMEKMNETTKMTKMRKMRNEKRKKKRRFKSQLLNIFLLWTVEYWCLWKEGRGGGREGRGGGQTQKKWRSPKGGRRHNISRFSPLHFRFMFSRGSSRGIVVMGTVHPNCALGLLWVILCEPGGLSRNFALFFTPTPILTMGLLIELCPRSRGHPKRANEDPQEREKQMKMGSEWKRTRDFGPHHPSTPLRAPHAREELVTVVSPENISLSYSTSSSPVHCNPSTPARRSSHPRCGMSWLLKDVLPTKLW